MRALLDDLTAAGVEIHRDGDRLQVIPPPGASLDPFRERIREAKSALLRAVLQAEIAELATLLEAGWEWLDQHPRHPEIEAFLARWVAKLHEYERVYCDHEGIAR